MPLNTGWADGQTFHGSDMDTITAQVNANTAALQSVYVNNYAGADPTGATASDAAVAAAITAMGSNPGILEFGVGTYRLNSPVQMFLPSQGAVGQGSAYTTIDYRGTGACFSAHDLVNSQPAHGGLFRGLNIFGWNNTNTNVTGLEVGDLTMLRIHDVQIQGFVQSGNIGYHELNKKSFAEKAYIDVKVDQCTNCYVFEKDSGNINTVASCDYSIYRLAFVTAANQNGITLKNNTQMFGVSMAVVGNCVTGASNTGVVLTVGTTGGDTSFITGNLQLSCETDGVTVAHADINVGAAAQINAYGALEFGEFPTAFRTGTASTSTVQFFGRINCPSLGRFTTTGIPLATVSASGSSAVARSQQVTEYVGATSVSGVSVPSGVKTALVTVIAAGSGGGSGRRGAAGTVRCGGGSAATSGAVYEFAVPASALGSTYSVTIPAAGAGGAAVTANSTDGNPGTRPSGAIFTSGSMSVSATAGDVGYGGTASSGTGGGFVGVGISTGALGASASTSGLAGNAGPDNFVGAPAASGSGGGVTSGDVAGNGGSGGTSWVFSASGGSGGVVGGASPGAGAAAVAGQPGAGAGGGAASITGAAQAGATPTGYGGGGAGGGASLNGNNSGAGSPGAPGYVRIVWEF